MSAEPVLGNPKYEPAPLGGKFPSKFYDGLTLAQICRLQGPACIEFLVKCRDDMNVPMANRLRAAEVLLDRGFGRAVQVIDTNPQQLTSLPREELIRIALGLQPRLPVVVDAEVSTDGITTSSTKAG